VTSTNSETRLRFWGVRGSIAAPGPATILYGGNTSCVELRADGEIIVLDAGTGIRPLGLRLVEEFKDRPLAVTILLTHTHWDHIQGFPFFSPAYDARNTVRILAFEDARDGLAAILGGQMRRPFFPIRLEDIPANIRISELQSMEFSVGAVQVRAQAMHHSSFCVGYRLTTSRGVVVFIADNEWPPPPGAPEKGDMTEFVRDADLLVMDAQYDRTEYQQRVGWGHGCVDEVTRVACRAGVKRLFLFHHDPEHDDDCISRMVAHARALATGLGSHIVIEAAREGFEAVL
jgi:phosphoribosyl 1,2-cyclic phosphodiesterase